MVLDVGIRIWIVEAEVLFLEYGIVNICESMS